MPHFYWKTIIFSVCATILTELRLNLLRFKNPDGTDWLVDVALGSLIIGIIINEKLGERWTDNEKLLMLAGFIVTAIVVAILDLRVFG